MIGLAQIKKQAEPKFDFDKSYYFGDLLDLNQAPQLNTPGILDQNPFVNHQEAPKRIQNHSLNMPILHPELSAFNMPIKEPEISVDYSLLIQHTDLE